MPETKNRYIHQTIIGSPGNPTQDVLTVQFAEGESLSATISSIDLPAGASTSENQETIIGHIDGIETLLSGTLTVDTGLAPLTNAELRALPLSVSGTFWQTTQPVSSTQLPVSLGVKSAANSLSVAPSSDAIFNVSEGFRVTGYDYISLGYTGNNLTTVIYKTGGAGGTTIATLSLTYDGNNNITSVTKS